VARLVLCAVVFVSCLFPSEVRAAETGVGKFHEFFAAGRFHDMYVGTHEEFRRTTSESDWIALLDKVRSRLGSVEATDQRGVDVVQAAGVITVDLTYATRFSLGAADEQFTFVIRSGEGLLRGYRIASKLLGQGVGHAPAAGYGGNRLRPQRSS
jgi:hypothetical protein